MQFVNVLWHEKILKETRKERRSVMKWAQNWRSEG